MALEGTVKLPGIGPVKKKSALYGTIGVVAFVAVTYYVRARKATTAPSSAGSAGSVTDPAGNTCSAVNPATGYCPGTAEDQAASAGTAAAGAPFDTSGLGGGGGGLSGYYYGPGGAVQATPPGPQNFADNAEWAQYVEAYLTTSLGGDPATVGNAIGKYLTGQPVTSDQVAIITEAIAYGGQPPQSGPGGDPPAINTAATNTGTSTSSSGGSTSTPPPAAAAGSISNLQASNVTKNSFTARWNAAQGATGGYKIVVSELNGSIVQTAVQHGTSLAVGHLHPGWTYNVGVQALPGGPGDNIHVPLPSK